MVLLNRRDFVKGVLAVGAGLTIPGCQGFFKGDYIKSRATKIFETKKNLEDQYARETGTDDVDYPPRTEDPYWSLSTDGVYTLNYLVEYGDPENLEKVIRGAINEKEDTLIRDEDNKRLIIITKNDALRYRLEDLLFTSDVLPPHVLVKLKASAEFANKTDDFSSEFWMQYKTKGAEYGSATAESMIPGGEPREMARASMINRWGVEIESEMFEMKAVLDVLARDDFVVHIYQTGIFLCDGKKGRLGGDEKLLIPQFIIKGYDTINSFELTDVESFFEATPYIYDGFARLDFRVKISGQKRPESRHRIMVPTSEEVQNDIYLPIGQPWIVAGQTREWERGTLRKDPFWPFPAGQDYAKRITRIWYEITPYRIIRFDPKTLVKPDFPVIELNSDVAPNVMLNPRSVRDYIKQNSLIEPAALAALAAYRPPEPNIKPAA